MLRQLIKLADHLDRKKLRREADFVDRIIRKATQINWGPSEWSDNGKSAYVHGYALDAFEDEYDRTFSWTVKVTNAISEWPELVNAGHGVESLEEAMEAAERCIKQEIKNNGIPKKRTEA